MYRQTTFLVVLLALFGAGLTFDLSTTKKEVVEFTEADIVPPGQTRLAVNDRGPGFIGDLIVGQRRADETIFTRVLEASNPSGTVQTAALNLNVNNGIIHYISVVNSPGSSAVICDQQFSLGSTSTELRVRLSGNSRAVLNLLVAAH